jgi:hypothetical protein
MFKLIPSNSGTSISKNPARRHPALKRDFFDQIDSPEKAYALGLIWSDGNLLESTGQVRIRLQASDADILEKLRIAMGAGVLSVIHPSGNAKSEQRGLVLSSQSMVRALKQLGLCEAKDRVLPPPVSPPPEFTRDFVRGLVDGDGCLQFVNKTPRVSFRNRNEGLRRIVADYWRGVTGTEPSLDGKKPHKITQRVYPSIYLSGKNAVSATLKMYENSDLSIDRKRKMAAEFLAWIPGAWRNRFLAGPATKRLTKASKGIGLFIDAPIARHMAVVAGDLVEISLGEDGSMTVRRVQKKSLDPNRTA